MSIVLADKVQCTGCGACYNICPQDAIEMRPDRDGFLQPVILPDKCVECGKCQQICPVLHPQYRNEPDPPCYALMASDEVRAVSSSGGAFMLAADQMFERGGLVFGAAWGEDWRVEQVAVDDPRDLKKLHSSKYLQSDTNTTYRQVKQALESGKPVLYSGVPCQIAGLYAYLGEREYGDQLWTVEVLCHGTPSHKVLKKYLEQNFDYPTLTRVDFRDKSVFKWSTTTTTTRDRDGEEHHIRETVDPYYQAFLPCMSMRNSCQICPFSRLPRQADLTLGDYWGIERFSKEWNDWKGTSEVLVNNKRGARIFEGMQARSRTVQTPLEYATHINKTILHPFNQHPGRKHFFSILDMKPFNQAVKAGLEHKYDVGVVGLWYGINYGSILTYYALYCVLRDMGYDAVMLPKPNNLWEERFNDPGTIAQRFIWPRCNVFLPMPAQEQFTLFNDNCEAFVLGSDVVWNYNICGNETGTFFFLDWVHSDRKKIAYASSFGNALEGPEQYVQAGRHYLRKFDAISVREDFGVQGLQDQGVDQDVPGICQVLDPVFLCPPAVYEEAISEAHVQEQSPFTFAYILQRTAPADVVLKALDQVADHVGAVTRICGNPVNLPGAKARYGERMLPEISVEDWLYYVKNSEYVIGDSYHLLCFALLFHKPFILCYKPEKRLASVQRFRSLLRLVGLEERLLRDWDTEQIGELLSKPIDWEDVDRRLAEKRAFSEKWLRDALERPARSHSESDHAWDTHRREVCLLSVRANERDERLNEKIDASERRKDALQRQVDASDRRMDALQRQVDGILASRSWRIGQAVTWLPRKVRGGVRCLRENGAVYTAKHFAQKVRHTFGST